MPKNRNLTPEDQRALEKIRDLLDRYPGQFGWLNDPATREFAHELVRYPPAIAITKAEEFRDQVQQRNDKFDAEYTAATKRKADLKGKPYYSLGRTGLIGILLRSFMASLNWTPLASPNWYEVTDRGLVIHTPFANVTERVITHADLAERRRELGVNPPAYMDGLLNFLKQLRFRKATAPWGSITVREPGSGVVLGEVVDFWPEISVAKIRHDLADIHRANNQRYASHFVLPRLVDFYSYYIDEWDDEYRIPPDSPPPVDEAQRQRTTTDDEDDEDE